MKRAARVLNVLYLLVLLLLWGVIYVDDGTLWLVTLFLFSPRWIVALPLLLLVPWTLIWTPKWIWMALIQSLVIVIPIMGFRVAIPTQQAGGNQPPLRIMTCNLGGGSINTAKLVALVKLHRTQVLLLQECPTSVSFPVFQQLGWQHRQAGNMAVGSSFELGELKTVARQPESHYSAVASIACDVYCFNSIARVDQPVASSERYVRVMGVHFPTFRPAFEKARRFERTADATFDDLSVHYRELAAATLQEAQVAQQANVPTLLAGDFNVPVESAFYRDYWGQYQNAYSLQGMGFGYSKYTRLHGIRIDHVVANDQWSVVSTVVGPDLGGDHRPVIVELQCTSY